MGFFYYCCSADADPWSGTCLLVGSAGYPSDRFLKLALFRILRFAMYGFIVYQTHHF